MRTISCARQLHAYRSNRGVIEQCGALHGLRSLEVNMCWLCYEDCQTVSFPTCEGCGKTLAVDQVRKYDLFSWFREYAEFVNQKRFVLFCVDCIEEMDKYHRFIVENKPRTEITIPENGMPEWRYILRRNSISVGIHHSSEQITLGIRCAKKIYGIDAVEEMIQGFVYHDDKGHQVKRLTLEDVDETVRCDKCWLPLWKCNAREVTI
jgi:hypothetical protein